MKQIKMCPYRIVSDSLSSKWKERKKWKGYKDHIHKKKIIREYWLWLFLIYYLGMLLYTLSSFKHSSIYMLLILIKILKKIRQKNSL